MHYLSLCMQHPVSDSEHPHTPSSEQSVGGECHLWLLQVVQPLLVLWLCWKTGQVPTSKGNTG